MEIGGWKMFINNTNQGLQITLARSTGATVCGNIYEFVLDVHDGETVTLTLGGGEPDALCYGEAMYAAGLKDHASESN